MCLYFISQMSCHLNSDLYRNHYDPKSILVYLLEILRSSTNLSSIMLPSNLLVIKSSHFTGKHIDLTNNSFCTSLHSILMIFYADRIEKKNARLNFYLLFQWDKKLLYQLNWNDEFYVVKRNIIQIVDCLFVLFYISNLIPNVSYKSSKISIEI